MRWCKTNNSDTHVDMYLSGKIIISALQMDQSVVANRYHLFGIAQQRQLSILQSLEIDEVDSEEDEGGMPILLDEEYP